MKTFDIWKKHLENALEKSRELSKEYESEHGDVNLREYSLFND